MLVWILINVSTSSGGVNPTPGGAHVSLNSGVGVYQTPTLGSAPVRMHMMYD